MMDSDRYIKQEITISGRAKKDIKDVNKESNNQELMEFYSNVYQDADVASFLLLDRRERLFGLLNLVNKDEFFIDVGCANGAHSDILYSRGIFGVSLDVAVPNILKGLEERPYLKFVHGFAENIPFGNGYFDVAILGDIVEHFRDIHVALAEILRVVKNGFVICFPNSEDATREHINPITVDIFEELCRFFALDIQYFNSFSEKIDEPDTSFLWVFARALKTDTTDEICIRFQKEKRSHSDDKTNVLELDQWSWGETHERHYTEIDRFNVTSVAVKGNNLLEVACGNGDLSVFLAERGYHVTGIDISSVGIEQAKKHAKNLANNTSFHVMDGTKLDFDDNSFDTVIFPEVFEHVSSSREYINEAIRVLKPGGRIVISVPDSVEIAWSGHIRLFTKQTLTTELEQYTDKIVWHEMSYRKWLLCSFVPSRKNKPAIIENLPLVSILMPTYNRADLIRNAIDSIINQTYTNWKLYIVNDGGEDVSQIISEYSDDRIVCYTIEHGGKPKALNHVLKMIKDGFIAYIDDDDIVFPNHIESLLKTCVLNKKEMAYSDTYLTTTNIDSNTIVSKTIENTQDADKDKLRFTNLINHKQIIHSKHLVDKIGLYDERMSVIIDYDYIKRLVNATNPVHLKTITGDHFLKISKGKLQNISGIWSRDPVVAGKSVLATFEKFPEDMAEMYMRFVEMKNSIETSDKIESLQLAVFMAHDYNFTDERVVFAPYYNGLFSLKVPSHFADYDSIRLDFGNKPCVLHLEGITVKAIDGTILYNFDGNEQDFKYANDISFFRTTNNSFLMLCKSNDPYIALSVIKSLSPIKEITVKVTYINSNAFYDTLYSEKDFYSNAIAELNTALSAKDKSINEKSEELDAKVVSILEAEKKLSDLNLQLAAVRYAFDTISNSTFWKITKPARLILDKIKKIFLSNAVTRVFYKTLRRIVSTLRKSFSVADNAVTDLNLVDNTPTSDQYVYKGIKYFDEEYYYSKYPDVKSAGIDALYHYFNYGWSELRNPSKYFNTFFYLTEYPDVKTSNVFPLKHFIDFGIQEGRYPTINEKVKLNYEKRLAMVRQNLSVVSHFHDRYTNVSLTSRAKSKKIAVHLYLTDLNLLELVVAKLNNVLVKYDLLVSTPHKEIVSQIEVICKSKLSTAKALTIEVVSDHGKDLAPLIITFGSKLLEYDFICHLNACSSNDATSNNSIVDTYENLLGSTSIVNQNINLLCEDANIIYSEPPSDNCVSNFGWDSYYNLSKSLLEKYTDIDISDYPAIDFPYNTMFWSKTQSITSLLKLPLSYDDFIVGDSKESSAISYALQRILLMLVSTDKGKSYCIYLNSNPTGFDYYEEQEDFSSRPQKSNDVKVLSYYLPQFHTTPENDKWHGKGFTEWTKVSSANALYYSHYQQHIPHDDISYYHLDSPDIFRKQLAMMQKAKVYGQIFYHYWFSGKLILEKPAQMLLENKDINMPFCFCWANENWTKKWDGNEAEVLLGQQYSSEDAARFIQYLMPFFKDSRYIRVRNRPVMFIYRPSSFPNFAEYKKVWELECRKAEVKPPYIVATLTRGTTSPQKDDMDAAVERVLWDWTDGNCPERKHDYFFYDAFKGCMLDYSDVASYYENCNSNRNFTYFRAIVPNWDNTARYSDSAYILNNSTPIRFQKWFKNIFDYTLKHLPKEEQFIIVNAWNEWAEGNHLEPDKKFGYAWLNAIGRELSVSSMTSKQIILGDEVSIPHSIKVFIKVDNISFLSADINRQTSKMIESLKKSDIFDLCTVFTDNSEIYNKLKIFKKINLAKEDLIYDYILNISDALIFPSDTFSKMLKMAIKYPDNCIIANQIYKTNADTNIPEIKDNFAVNGCYFDFFSCKLIPQRCTTRAYKVRADAMVYLLGEEKQNAELPIISTVIRFHKNAKYEFLEKALFSLATQSDCLVQPMVMCQDVDELGMQRLDNLVGSITWDGGCKPKYFHYKSDDKHKDLRSKMLNEGLQKAETRYVTFLDYDDFLYPFAYSWLLARLKSTDKAVSYGNVYTAWYDIYRQAVIMRERTYEYDVDYLFFVGKNHAPIHSLMIDISKVDRKNIQYFDEQKYMEDYYMMLQIITADNTDWDSLKFTFYIGDYMHFTGEKINSLAVYEDKIFEDPEYVVCDEIINQLREKIVSSK